MEKLSVKAGTFFLYLLFFSCNAFAQANKANNNYNINLIKNPGAEAEDPDNQVASWQPLPATEVWGQFNDNYGHTGGEWDWDCDEKCGLPPNSGTYYFRFPVDNSGPILGMWQDVDLSFASDTLLKRKINYSFSAFVAGFSCDTGCAKAVLQVAFFDTAGKQVGINEISKDNSLMKQANEDGRMRKFEKLNLNGDIPAGTIKATVTMKADSKECCNGGYVFFDNLDLSVSKGDYRKP